jgi:Flp pilus assembly protein TadD
MAAAHFNFGRRLELFQQRVALAPNDAAAHRDLGLTYEEQGADEVAYAELVIALLIDPADVASLTALGRLHIAAGDYARAVETLQRAVSFAPQYGAAVQALGTALMRSGRAEDGRKRLDEAMRLHFFSVDEQRRLRKAAALIDDAEIHMRERRYSEAVILWQRALQLESMNAAMHVRLGEALAATKRYVEAAAQFEQAIALKGNPDAHLRLAETYAAMGRTDDSARERRAYIESRLQPLRRQSVQPN